MECETEWAINKKIVDLKNKDLRRAIPNGLPYFMVQFGNNGGYAHVIEDERMFPTNFAEVNQNSLLIIHKKYIIYIYVAH